MVGNDEDQDHYLRLTGSGDGISNYEVYMSASDVATEDSAQGQFLSVDSGKSVRVSMTQFVIGILVI